MTVGIKILPKVETLDVQGRAIADTLNRQGYSIENCRFGKFIKVEVKAKNEDEALNKVRKMAEDILCHSLVENYEVELLSN